MQNRTVLIWIARIGDFVISIPFIKQYKKNNPDRFLSVIVPDFVVPVAQMVPEIDEVISFPKKNKLKYLKFIYKMLTSKWDTSINMNPSFSTTAKIVNRFTGARERIGFWNKKDNSIFTKLVDCPEEKENMLETFWRLSEAIGFECRDMPTLVLGENEKNDADEIIRKNKLDEFIVIHPGNFGKTRTRWPEDKFISLSKMIAEKKNIRQVMLAGPGEEEQVKAIVDAVGSDKVMMIYNMSLKVTVAFLARAKAFIGNSTGTLHMADAVGVPSVSINNVYCYHCWRPMRETAVAVQSNDWRDLTGITPEEVYDGLLEMERKNNFTLE